MSFDQSWDHQFCLSCDRQTDGATYCSESCRLSDFESSSPSTMMNTRSSSLGLAASSHSWATSKSASSKFYLSPAYDFSNAQPYGSTPQPQSPLAQRSELMSASSGRALTPSSSHSSLCSLQSNSSIGSDSKRLSEKAKKQLRDYASSFEHAKVQRRRSY
ncbi:hypothetical protein PG996_003690 [Apiospora saccharicola]|uniref:Life-span regulatory factor domain-containing protein n=1 Tax=Apiospora saccharicola TaxID=335842 RepID=A0ABR1W1Z4_9PEZI